MAKSKKDKGKGGTDGGRKAKAYHSMKFKSKAKKRGESCEVFKKDKDHVIVVCYDSYSPEIRKYTRKIRKIKRKKAEHDR